MLSASGAIIGSDNPKQIVNANSPYIKSYSFAYNNTKLSSQSSPKKGELFIVKEQNMEYDELKDSDVWKISGKKVNSMAMNSFKKEKEFGDEFTEVQLTETTHNYQDQKHISFSKPIKFTNNADFHEVTNFSPVEYASREDDWV